MFLTHNAQLAVYYPSAGAEPKCNESCVFMHMLCYQGQNFTSTFGRTYYGGKSLSRNTASQQTVLFMSDVAKLSYRIHTGKKGVGNRRQTTACGLKETVLVSVCLPH